MTDRLLVGAAEAAELCGVSKRHWLSLDSAGKIPLSVKLGSRRLWSVDSLRQWVQQGCKPRGDDVELME